MLEFNEIGRFDDVEIEEGKHPEHGAVTNGISEVTDIYATFHNLGTVAEVQSHAEAPLYSMT